MNTNLDEQDNSKSNPGAENDFIQELHHNNKGHVKTRSLPKANIPNSPSDILSPISKYIIDENRKHIIKE